MNEQLPLLNGSEGAEHEGSPSGGIDPEIASQQIATAGDRRNKGTSYPDRRVSEAAADQGWELPGGTTALRPERSTVYETPLPLGHQPWEGPPTDADRKATQTNIEAARAALNQSRRS